MTFERFILSSLVSIHWHLAAGMTLFEVIPASLIALKRTFVSWYVNPRRFWYTCWKRAVLCDSEADLTQDIGKVLFRS